MTDTTDWTAVPRERIGSMTDMGKDEMTGTPTTTTEPSETERGELTLEQLREWLVVQAKHLEGVADDPALLTVDRWKVNGMHRAFTKIASIIESGALPND